MRDGAPDYTAETFDSRQAAFKDLQKRLMSIDTAGWTIADQVDWTIVWSEMNGYDFNYRVLKPWVRDPAFYKSVYTYQSDVPAHEGPTHHKTTEIWTYEFPLSAGEKNRLLEDLKVIPPLNDQARINLTGNARDLWIAGIRDIKRQVKDLKDILNKPGVKEDPDLADAIVKAIASTQEFAQWLETEAQSKNGPSGIGKENYTWYMQNVHRVPLTWEDEVMILKREIGESLVSIKTRGTPKS